MAEKRFQEIRDFSDITMLSHEITYVRYLINKGRGRELFQALTIPEYIILFGIARKPGKTYLREIAEKMEISVTEASAMVRKLRDRGLLIWSHDGDGSEGTYVQIMQEGVRLLDSQEKVLKQYYTDVVGRFGYEKMIQLIRLLRELEEEMSTEMDLMEEKGL